MSFEVVYDSFFNLLRPAFVFLVSRAATELVGLKWVFSRYLLKLLCRMSYCTEYKLHLKLLAPGNLSLSIGVWQRLLKWYIHLTWYMTMCWMTVICIEVCICALKGKLMDTKRVICYKSWLVQWGCCQDPIFTELI